MNQTWGRLPITLGISAACAVAGMTLLAACAAPTDNAAPAAEHSAQPQPGMTGMTGMTMAASGAGVATDDAPVATNTVTIQNFAYAPATVTVKAGTTITWTNQDQDQHTVTAMNGGPFHSPPLNTGESFHFTFTTPGHFEYLCTIHPFMTATVVVTP
jgi:plastocyanin